MWLQVLSILFYTAADEIATQQLHTTRSERLPTAKRSSKNLVTSRGDLDESRVVACQRHGLHAGSMSEGTEAGLKAPSSAVVHKTASQLVHRVAHGSIYSTSKRHHGFSGGVHA